MNHLYQNDDGEIVVADSAEQAGRYHDCELGGEPEPGKDWVQLPDDGAIPMSDLLGTVTKTAGEWAAEFSQPTHFSTTYT